MANDFPFGPNFHYVVLSNRPVHTWEEVKFKDLLEINLLTHEFLSIDSHLHGAAGVEFGFNSTVRHLVLGSKTHSSAGASIPHLHKQIWGMAPRSTNLADQLIRISEAYSDLNIDYQNRYLNALREANYVICEDDNVALYVPFGQCSMHELQVVLKRPNINYLELSIDEVRSLTLAEYLVFRLYKRLGIQSFNSVFLSKEFDDRRAPDFHLVETFITREVDLAVSELSGLFVVDQHPAESKDIIKKAYKHVKTEKFFRRIS